MYGGHHQSFIIIYASHFVVGFLLPIISASLSVSGSGTFLVSGNRNDRSPQAMEKPPNILSGRYGLTSFYRKMNHKK